jgi:hypothetical protein
MKTKIIGIIPVIPSANIERDLRWYKKKAGFTQTFVTDGYAGMARENMQIHLQWHADTPDDPLLGGSVVKIFVEAIEDLFEELIERGVVSEDKLNRNTPWGTNEFGFFDLNKNAVFFVEVIA